MTSPSLKADIHRREWHVRLVHGTLLKVSKARAYSERHHAINPVSRLPHRSFDGGKTWKGGPTEDW